MPSLLIFAASAYRRRSRRRRRSSRRRRDRITAPKEEFGNNIGDDFFLANFQQMLAYWKKLDSQSDRMQLVEIGQTALKRPQHHGDRHVASQLLAA